jgi:hypothetical protein
MASQELMQLRMVEEGKSQAGLPFLTVLCRRLRSNSNTVSKLQERKEEGRGEKVGAGRDGGDGGDWDREKVFTRRNGREKSAGRQGKVRGCLVISCRHSHYS